MKTITKRKQWKQVHEVEITYSRPILEGAYRITSSNDAEILLRKIYPPKRIDYKEFFYVLLLSRYSQVLGVAHISTGSTSGTVINVPEIIQLALLSNASSIILSHNHPSGNLKPSDADIAMTKRVQEVCALLEIKVLDHLILSSESYYSFADAGVL